MDARALENLRVKIAGFISNCILIDSSIEDDENWKRIEVLAVLVSKLKSQWINERQAQNMISSIILRSIPKTEYGSRFNGKLSDFVDSAELCNQIYNRIIGLPYNYNIYYELPNVTLPVSAEIFIGSSISIQLHNDSFIKSDTLSERLGIKIEGASCYLRIRVVGYCDYDLAGVTPQKSLTLLKVFVERGKESGVLQDNLFLRLWPQNAANPEAYVHEVDCGVTITSFRLSISKDVSEALTSLQLSTAVYRDGDIQRLLLKGMMAFLKLTSSDDIALSRIVAACEWSFDADSEQVPAMKVVKVCIGLESVYSEDNSEGGLTKSLSDRCAYSLASSASERKEFMMKCRDLYRLRSSVVHGVKRIISASDSELINFGMSILTASINKEISLLPGN